MAQLNQDFKYSISRGQDGLRLEDNADFSNVVVTKPSTPPSQLWRVKVVRTAQETTDSVDAGADVVTIQNEGTGQFLRLSGKTADIYPITTGPHDPQDDLYCTEWVLRPTADPEAFFILPLRHRETGVVDGSRRLAVAGPDPEDAGDPDATFWARPVLVDLNAANAVQAAWRFRHWL